VTPGALLSVWAAAAVVILILLIVQMRMSPYIALILMSLGLALATGIPAGTIVEGFEAGVGGALGYITLRGLTLDTIRRFTNECLAPTAMITLVVGMGAGFGRVLTDSGASAAIVALAGQ